MRYGGQSPSADLSQGAMVPPFTSVHDVNARMTSHIWLEFAAEGNRFPSSFAQTPVRFHTGRGLFDSRWPLL
jgi:hypothetical protein